MRRTQDNTHAEFMPAGAPRQAGRPWSASPRLFRQLSFGAWPPAMEAVAAAYGAQFGS
ncbi:MAG: hypothetical protein JWP86_2101 [Phenylobacterium sp.]|nr:hypothetical protein [Phenylobacterium sp.]